VDTSKALQLYDYVVIVGYFAIILGTSIYFSRRAKLSSDFFVAGGRMPWWLAGISFYMASQSALSFVMYGELAYKYGITAILIFQSSVVGLILAGLYVAKRWRRSRTITPIQFLERRYSLYMRQALAWTGLPVRMMDDGMKIFSTAIFLFVGMRLEVISLPVAITLVGIVMVVYALTGGQKGVIVTDFLQFIIIMLIVVIIFIVTVVSFVNRGYSLSELPVGFLEPFSGPYHPLDYFSFVVLMIISINTTWSLVQKYSTVPSEKDASKVAWFVAVLELIAPVVFFLPPVLARLFLTNLTHPEYTYATLAFTVLPTGLMGILVVGMFASTIACMGSEFNVLAGILTNDLYKRVFNPNASDRQLVYVGKVTTVIVGFFVTVIAILIGSLRGFNLFDIMLKSFGALLPATALPILVGFFWKRITARGALYGLIVGATVGILQVVINALLLGANAARMAGDPLLTYWLKQGWNSIAILFDCIVTILAMYFASLRHKASFEERQRAESYFNDLNTRMALELEKAVPNARLSNAQVIAVATFLFGLLIIGIGIAIILGHGRGLAILMNVGTGLFLLLVGSLIYFKEQHGNRTS